MTPQSAANQPDENVFAVVHLFGHHKQDHVLLRELIAKRMLQFVAGGADAQEFLRKLSLRAVSVYAHN